VVIIVIISIIIIIVNSTSSWSQWIPHAAGRIKCWQCGPGCCAKMRTPYNSATS